MIKTLDFGEKKVNFSTSFAWTFAYKAQFHKDPAQLLIPVVKTVNNANAEDDKDKAAEEASYKIYEMLGLTGIAEIAWSMAKILDKNLPEPVTWVASFEDDFPASDIANELIPEAILSCFSSKKSSVPIPAETKKTAPTETK